MKELRIAIDGCYPSFWDTDLVLRIIRSTRKVVKAPSRDSCDLLIKGPFADGSRKRRFVSAIRQFKTRMKKTYYQPVSLHVSSENHNEPNYQSFAQSKCDYGIGHEFLDSKFYFRAPHWYNYLNLECFGVHTPPHWPRLGQPIEISALLNPISWNSSGLYKAAFITSNLTYKRLQLFKALSVVLPVDGFGSAFNPSIKNQLNSGFTKRELLANYQYCFCPENSVALGYYTEKVPEAYISGSIPITYADKDINQDFNPDALINLASFETSGILQIDDLSNYLCSADVLSSLTSTALVNYSLESRIDGLRKFIFEIISTSQA